MTPVVNDEQQREAFRKQHDVRVVGGPLEGTGVDQQGNGTYGFTYAPTGAAPMFGQRKFQNFEIHKAMSGEKFILGYVTAAEAQSIAAMQAADLKLYPDHFEQSTELVCLSLEDVSLRPQHSGQPGSPAPLRYEP